MWTCCLGIALSTTRSPVRASFVTSLRPSIIPSESLIFNISRRYHYKNFIGGILMLTLRDFRSLNGMSNKYWGWGLEDDELFLRIRYFSSSLLCFQRLESHPDASGESDFIAGNGLRAHAQRLSQEARLQPRQGGEGLQAET